MSELQRGLSKTLTDVPVGHGHVDLLGGYSVNSGLFARVEGVAHLRPNLGVFGFAQADQRVGVTAGLGARMTF